MEEKKEDGMGTLKKDRTLLRDERKMEKLKAKLHTDDDCEFKKENENTSFPYFFIFFFKVKSFTRNMLYMESGSLVAHVHSSLRYLPAFTGMWEY